MVYNGRSRECGYAIILIEKSQMDENLTQTDGRRKASGAAVIRSDLTASLFVAFFQEWAEYGYAALSLERVAARAGAGKAAIYRRWASKREFASAALQTVSLKLADFSDHGSLEGDVTAYLIVTRRVFRHPLARRILPDMQAERIRSGDLSEMLDRMSEPRRARGHELLNRAIARGELPDQIDQDLALDLLMAPLYVRMLVRNQAVPRTDIDKQTRVIIAGFRAC